MTEKTSGFYTSGWCGSCGRRRAADGRCLNCDAWWTSPLVQVGGPVVVLGTLLILVSLSLVRSFSHPGSEADRAAERTAAAAPASSYYAPAGGALNTPVGVSPVSPYQSSSAFSAAPRPAPAMPVPVTASFAPPPPSPAQLAWASQMQLVQNAGYVDHAIQSDDDSRTAALRGGSANPAAMSMSRSFPRQMRSIQAEPMDDTASASAAVPNSL